MSKKKSSLFKKLVITGTATGVACYALGSLVVEKFLSKNGIREIIEKDALMPNEDSACFYESEEALAGIEFYRKTPCKEVFTFNKYSECLHADFYEADEPSDIYAISCHGFTGMPSQNSIYTKRFRGMGFNVLLPYLRAHGKSEHKYCTMGLLERLDIIDWVNYIIDKNPNAKIILHGVSMGASTVMMATGEKLPENVVCCIEDCGFTSFWEEYSKQIKEMFNLPPNFVLNLANLAAKIKIGIDLKAISPLRAVKGSRTPTLFIHGDKDSVVPFWMNYPLYQSAACEKERLVVSGATHAASGYCYPDIYWEAITKFINKYI